MLKNFQISYSIALNSLKHDFNRRRNMVIHHGLMGNAKNFRSISKNISISDYCNSELIDCRNHGSSPHTETHTMDDLADDLYQLLKKRIQQDDHYSWKNVTLMGHSMGAIALMAFSVKYPEMQEYIDRMIMIDIPCVKMEGTASWNRTGKMLQSMLQVDLTQDIMKVFTEIEDRAFSPDVANLLKSNIQVSKNYQPHRWIPNIKTIVKDYNHVGSFSLNENNWRKPVQVIYGDKSHYVDEAQIRLYEKYYPQMTDDNFYKIRGAGHWVHFDKTKQFLAVVKTILEKDQL